MSSYTNKQEKKKSLDGETIKAWVGVYLFTPLSCSTFLKHFIKEFEKKKKGMWLYELFIHNIPKQAQL